MSSAEVLLSLVIMYTYVRAYDEHCTLDLATEPDCARRCRCSSVFITLCVLSCLTQRLDNSAMADSGSQRACTCRARVGYQAAGSSSSRRSSSNQRIVAVAVVVVAVGVVVAVTVVIVKCTSGARCHLRLACSANLFISSTFAGPDRVRWDSTCRVRAISTWGSTRLGHRISSRARPQPAAQTPAFPPPSSPAVARDRARESF